MAVDEAVRHTALLPGGIAPDARDADPRGIHLARAWGLDKTDIDGNRFLAATHAAADVTEAIAGWREPIRRLRAKGALPAARGQ